MPGAIKAERAAGKLPARVIYTGPAPECPPYLDATAREEWGRVAPELAALGLLARVDSTALAAYCATFSHWRACEADVAANGQVLTDAKGKAYANPAVKLADLHLKQLRSLCTEFGFTPNSRGRMDVPQQPDAADTAFDDFVGGG